MATDNAISRGNRSHSRYAVAPGVTTMAITRNAPTVCIAATTDAASSTKNTARSRSGRRPMDRAWFSSKNATSMSFHFSSRTVNDTTPMIASCSVSPGLMARMLPMVIVCTLIATGLTDTMNSPRPKNAVKMMPMITSIFSPDRPDRNSIAPAANPPARNAPSANGRPSM